MLILNNMHTYIKRDLEIKFRKYCKIFPVIAILGPRQCGKSTLAKELGKKIANFEYIDLELPSDRQKLQDSELFFNTNKDKIICLDEIQLMPEIFAILRGVIDKNRINGQFIVLGSASPDLIKQSSESLAGRIGYLELTPFTYNEISGTDAFTMQKFWLKGGFPLSYLSDKAELSHEWRLNYIKTFIERDIPSYGIKSNSVLLQRFIRMCAHYHGDIINYTKLGESLILRYRELKNYLDIFEASYIFRTLQPYSENTKKRLIKSPKFYIRDSGIFHALIGVLDMNDLLGHPSFGSSWEGFVIENILSENPDWQSCFYRNSNGNEIDLVLSKGDKKVAIEIKASSAPDVNKGFYFALDDIGTEKGFIIAPVEKSYEASNRISVLNLKDFLYNNER